MVIDRVKMQKFKVMEKLVFGGLCILSAMSFRQYLLYLCQLFLFPRGPNKPFSAKSFKKAGMLRYWGAEQAVCDENKEKLRNIFCSLQDDCIDLFCVIMMRAGCEVKRAGLVDLDQQDIVHVLQHGLGISKQAAERRYSTLCL